MQPLLLGQTAAKLAAVIRSPPPSRPRLRHGDHPSSKTIFGPQYLRYLPYRPIEGSQQLRAISGLPHRGKQAPWMRVL
jgi:hypothetical protein